MTNQTILRGRAMNLADYEFARFGVKVPAGTTLEDVLNPAYFQNYTNHLKPGAEVIVLSDDFELDVAMRVTRVSKTSVNTRVIRDSSIKPAKAVKEPDASGYSVSWGGPSHKHRVMQNGEVLVTGFGSKEDAEAHILTLV